MLKARTALLLLFLVAAFFPAMQAEAARETMTPIWQHVEGKEIERLAQEKLEALFLAAGETRRREAVLMTSPRDLRLPAGRITFTVEAPQGLSYSRGTAIYVSVFLDGKLYRRIGCYYKLRVYDTVLVAAKTILPGDFGGGFALGRARGHGSERSLPHRKEGGCRTCVQSLAEGRFSDYAGHVEAARRGGAGSVRRTCFTLSWHRGACSVRSAQSRTYRTADSRAQRDLRQSDARDGHRRFDRAHRLLVVLG